MKNFVLTLLLVILTGIAPVFAQNTIAHAVISFKIKNLGIYTSGTIGGLQATVHFVPDNLVSSSVTAAVDVNTLNTDNSTRDEHLKSDEFFDLPHYPHITLKSISFRRRSGNNYSGMFWLTIKNKTKQLEIPFSLIDKGNTQAFSSTFKINRRDFGVGDDSFTLSDDVIVTIEAEGAK